MEKGVILNYRNLKREFFISAATKPHIINTLIRKAFRLTSDIKQLRHPRGYHISISEVFQLQHGRYFEVLTEDDEESRERSENYSQKNMAKSSGRKFPPSQRELLDSKFFLEDFQLFMSEVTSKHSKKHFGIVFFSNKRKAQFLGKKILRELVFEFDNIEFFYTLHPIKLHSTSKMLGEVLLFAIFKGNKMIIQREFSENLSATQEISSYLKLIIGNGQLCLEPKPKNLIEVQEHNRSFGGQKLDSPRERLQQEFQDIKQLDLFKNQSSKLQGSSPDIRIDSPMKSHLTNEISFENQFYQPSWFFEGDPLNRIEKSFLSALIKNNDVNLIHFCSGIDLKNQRKEQLNIKLLKVFLKQFIDEKLASLKEDMKFYIELNQENRHSPVFSLLLRLQKFGNIPSFVEKVSQVLEKSLQNSRISYVDIARQIQTNGGLFSIRLKGCDDISPTRTPKTSKRLSGKTEQLHYKNAQIASHFHNSFPDILKASQRNISLPGEFSPAERAMITDKILKNDPFLIQNYIASRWSHKKFPVLSVAIVRQYLKSSASRYGILEEIVLDQPSRRKLNKLESFRNLLYFLYKQRIINKKQQKVFFYLYVWNDLNLLASYQVYMADRNLEEFIETIYSIDYTYYLQQKYGLEMNEVENFTLQIQLQLVFMMLFGEYIRQLENKVAIEKFIRAGDCTLLRIVKDHHEDRQAVIKKVIEFGESKRQGLEQISRRQVDAESRIKELKRERKNFVQQILPVHFKGFKKVALVYDCIENQEENISSIFSVYEVSNQLVEWIESFQLYTKEIDKIHMKMTLKLLSQLEGLEYEKVKACRTDVITGIYELHMITKNQAYTKESLRRAVNKLSNKEN